MLQLNAQERAHLCYRHQPPLGLCETPSAPPPKLSASRDFDDTEATLTSLPTSVEARAHIVLPLRTNVVVYEWHGIMY